MILKCRSSWLCRLLRIYQGFWQRIWHGSGWNRIIIKLADNSSCRSSFGFWLIYWRLSIRQLWISRYSACPGTHITTTNDTICRFSTPKLTRWFKIMMFRESCFGYIRLRRPRYCFVLLFGYRLSCTFTASPGDLQRFMCQSMLILNQIFLRCQLWVKSEQKLYSMKKKLVECQLLFGIIKK